MKGSFLFASGQAESFGVFAFAEKNADVDEATEDEDEAMYGHGEGFSGAFATQNSVDYAVENTEGAEHDENSF